MASLETLKGQYEKYLFNHGSCIELKNLFDLPREDNIKRIRATIQNYEGRYLPTSWEVAKKRGIEENKWRSFIGYPVGNPNQTTMNV